MEFLSSPVGIGAAFAVAGVLLLALKRRGNVGSSGPARTGEDREIDKLLERGEYARAAGVALRTERFREAVELFLRAQQPGNAAQVAVRMGDMRKGAELYERAGDAERAAHFFRKAGMDARADELEGLALAAEDPARVEAADGERISRARELEREFRDAKATDKGKSERVGALQERARAAAEALLKDGEIRRAAEVYRDAGLDDEAIHLLVNVLGSPGEAAPLLAARGNHERAAELYELAGQKERAAASWVEVAHGSKRPDSFIDRIESLSRRVALEFMERETQVRPLSAGTVELHYRYAGALERMGEVEGALQIFDLITSTLGGYKDVIEHIDNLRAGRAPAVSFDRSSPELMVPSPEVRPADTGRALSASDVQRLGEQVAQAAVARLKMADVMQQLSAIPGGAASPKKVRAELNVVGLEQGAGIAIELLADSAVEGARAGPSVASLLEFTGDRACDLGNIEVFYRLGLAYLAQGQWQRALEAFDAVEETSPGYRDADRRAEELRAWKGAVGDAMSVVGGAPRRADGEGSRYELQGELGRGGMAVVYRANDTVLGREVALKFLAEEFSTRDEMRAMFEREARSVAALNHPNIVTIYDFGVLEGRAYICMELVDGKSIEELHDQDNGLTIVESLQVTKQALDALAYAHARKIIHRDIKPANIMRASTGLVKLMDFGLAKSLDKSDKESIIAGTPAYMPPEQLAGQLVDHRADIFSLGVTLYELLTRHMPFDGLIRECAPAPLTEHVPAIPPLLDDTVMKAIQLDPRLRFGTAAEMSHPIQQILDAVHSYAGRRRPADPAPRGARGAQKTELLPGAAKPLGTAATEILPRK